MIETYGKIELTMERNQKELLIGVRQGSTILGNQQLVHVNVPIDELGIALDDYTVKRQLKDDLRTILDILEV
jgi:hypothetical protein